MVKRFLDDHTGDPQCQDRFRPGVHRYPLIRLGSRAGKSWFDLNQRPLIILQAAFSFEHPCRLAPAVNDSAAETQHKISIFNIKSDCCRNTVHHLQGEPVTICHGGCAKEIRRSIHFHESLKQMRHRSLTRTADTGNFMRPPF